MNPYSKASSIHLHVYMACCHSSELEAPIFLGKKVRARTIPIRTVIVNKGVFELFLGSQDPTFQGSKNMNSWKNYSFLVNWNRPFLRNKCIFLNSLNYFKKHGVLYQMIKYILELCIFCCSYNYYKKYIFFILFKIYIKIEAILVYILRSQNC